MTDSVHLNDVRVTNSSQLLPLYVELRLLNFSLKVLDGDLPGPEVWVVSHRPEHRPEGTFAQQDPALYLLKSDFFQADGVLLYDVTVWSIRM